MKAKMVWGNFSVSDVKRTQEFYSQLGFVSNNTNDYPKLASFLFGDNKQVIHFFERGSQIDEYLPAASEGKSEIMFTLSAETEEQVKEWAEKVRKSGGKIVSEPARDQQGYYGFVFADPDGHQFNVLLIEAGM